MSTGLISTWPRMLMQVAFNAGGNSGLPSHWYTLTPRLRDNWNATLAGRQYETDAIESGSMSYTLDNSNGDFDPDNASGFFYPYVVPYRRARLVLVTGPSQNLAYWWMATGQSTTSQAASAGSLSTASGLSVSSSGLTTAITWSLASGVAAGASYGLTGAVSSWSTTDCNCVTVHAGETYSVGVDARLSAGGMSSLGAHIWMGYFSLAGTLVSSFTSSSTSLTTSNHRLTASGAVPAGAAFLAVALVTDATTTAATTVQATAWQIELSASPTAYTYPGTWQQVWQGFVERWQQRYDYNGKYGKCDVTCVDALAPLSQLTMGYVMPSVVRSYSPDFLFDLATPAGVTFAESNGKNVSMVMVGSNVTAGNNISSTDDIGTLWNTPGPVVTFDNSQTSGENTSSYIESTGIMLSNTGPFSRMICFRTEFNPTVSGQDVVETLWSATDATAFRSAVLQVGPGLAADTKAYCTLNIISPSASLTVNNFKVPVNDGNWHCAIVTLGTDGKTVNLWVDGISVQGVGSADLHPTCTSDAIGAVFAINGTHSQGFNGDVAWFAHWDSVLSNAAITDISNGFANGWAGDTNIARTSRILGYSAFHGASGPKFIGSSAVMGGVAIQDRSPLDILQESADTECGQFAVDYNGALVMYGQLWRWMQTQPRVIFGENTAAGEIPYLDDITFEQDPAHLYNDIQVTVDGAVDLTDANSLQESQDAISQAAYFPQTLQRNANPQLVQGGLNVANYLLSQFKDPHSRLDGITVDLMGNSAVLPAVAALQFSDRVRVNRRAAGAPLKTLDCFIEQIAWSGDDTGALQLQMQMSPASQYQYAVISATWAPLAAGIASGVSTITVSSLNGLSLIPAQFVIPKNYQMTLGFGTATSETVTVSSVQTVSVGYTSVQLTLSSPTAHNHSAGDLLCDIEPAGITLPPVGSYPTCLDIPSLTGGATPLIGF